MTSSKKLNTNGASQRGTDPMISMDSTVSTFSNRLQRKLKEQEVQDDVSQRDAEARHAKMLQAMNTIRKALQDTCKIRLGDRFHFHLEVDDWEGWPRVILNLVDAFAPEQADYGLTVTANDRHSLGTILISRRTGEVLGKIHLCNPSELTRLPLLLKKTVRKFLDVVAEYVLNPVDPEDLLESQTKSVESDHLDEIDHTLQKTNLFADEDTDLNRENIISTLQESQPLDALPSAAQTVESPGDNNMVEEDDVQPIDAAPILGD
ncbi:hypothetical protein OAO01_04275 [Oligoflexia bacterium]|nr:hypothetical protein [Oligoflexia bacterium]